MMKVVVVGCGGIGGILAAKLIRAGVDVTCVTGNAEIAAAIADRGLRVTELDGYAWTARPARAPLIAPEAGGDRFDMCLLATKATTMIDALRAVAPSLADDAPVVCLQNGLPEAACAAVVGAERVVGCVVGWGATMESPGAYVRTSRGGLQVGGGTAANVDRVVGLLELAEDTQAIDNFEGVRWSKLAINCATSTLGAIGGERLGALLRRRSTRRLVLELWTEVVHVARAAGVRMALVGGTMDIEKMALTPSERRTAWGSRALLWKHSLLMAVGMKYRRMRSSMLVAIERGRVPEIDFLNGEVARLGAALGVATPVNARLCAAVKDVIAKRERPAPEHLRQVFQDLAGERGPRAAERRHAA
jgi:2-dehydropantoate 2-reductase